MSSQAELAPHTPVRVEALHQLPCSPEDLAAVTKAMAWVETVLVAPDPDLGRNGSVCPFIRSSLNERMVYVACRLESDCDDPELEAALRRSRDWFLDLQRDSDPHTRHLAALVTVLPRIDHRDAEPLNDLHASLKPEFVSQGLMIGQFHPKCDRPGIRSPQYRPLQSPVPFMAIRAMVPSDLPLLLDDPGYAATYFEQFASLIPAHVRQFAADRLVGSTMRRRRKETDDTDARQVTRQEDRRRTLDASNEQLTGNEERTLSNVGLPDTHWELSRTNGSPSSEVTTLGVPPPLHGGASGSTVGAHKMRESPPRRSSARLPELDLVIPALNEEARIGATLSALTERALESDLALRILVVDNGSVDSTADVAARSGYPEVPVEVLSCRTRGKGAAVRAGILRSSAPYVGYCDADLSTPASAVDLGVDLLRSGWEVVIGSRRCTGASYTVPQGGVRRLGSLAFRTAAGDLIGPITDSQCGFKLFHSMVAKSLFASSRSTGFAFDVEVLARARRSDYRMIELPVRWKDSPQSTFRPLADGVNSFRELRRVRQSLAAPSLADYARGQVST